MQDEKDKLPVPATAVDWEYQRNSSAFPVERHDESSNEHDQFIQSAEVNMQFRKVSSTMPVMKKEICGSKRFFNLMLLFVSLMNMCIIIGLTIVISVYIIKERTFKDPDVTLAAALLVNAAFNMYYIVRGVLKQKKYFVGNFAVGVLIIFLYCLLDVIFNSESNSFLLKIRFAILAGLSVPNLILCSKVCKYYRWNNFKIVGASEAIQIMYTQLCYFCSLLTFDLQASFTLIILRLNHGINLSLPSIIMLAAGIPLCALFNIIGLVSVQWEFKWLVWTFVVLSLAQPAYIIVDITRMYLSINDDFNALITYSILIAGSVSIIVRVILLYELRPVYRNFGYGLQDKAFAGLVACEKTSLLSPPSR